MKTKNGELNPSKGSYTTQHKKTKKDLIITLGGLNG